MLKLQRPVAIAMWDFSWLERRWPGAGYESWELALDQLVQRGYDAVRIDAYPHFVEWGNGAALEVLPTWHFVDWGATMKCDVSILPSLIDFVAACAKRNIRVGLSTWFREDRDNVRMRIADPLMHARVWLSTLERIAQAGLLGSILYLDFCNEWPGDRWAPFFKNDPPTAIWDGNTVKSQQWMKRAVEVVREYYPDLPLTFSFWPDEKTDKPLDFSFLDLFEPHLWLARHPDWHRLINYGFEPFDAKGMQNVANNAAMVYLSSRRHFQDYLAETIDSNAAHSRKTGRGLITTECWGPVDYKDGPRFDWDWVKESCAFGVQKAASTGRWLGIATSNFCGPQFVGMWRDVAWHQYLTGIIKSAPLESDLRA